MQMAGLGFDDTFITRMIDSQDSPAHVAARNGHFEVLKRLVDDIGFEPRATNIMGWSPLHFACTKVGVDFFLYVTLITPHCRFWILTSCVAHA